MSATVSALIAERGIAAERFAMAGRSPRFAARPHDRDELCELLRAATRDGLAVVPWGGGTALTHEAAPERYDLALDLGALDRVIEYQPEDLTLTAECGVPIATLRAQLAARGQELPLEAAHAERATLGGVLSANASGARRRRFGAPRDRILGARFVLGDGTLARTGGKVVKNVAGYGIHRLLCGARGGLAIVVEASLKLLPGPAARAALIYAFDDATLGDARRWARFPRLEPAALTVVDGATAAAATLPGAERAPGTTWAVLGFEDDPPRVAELAAHTAGVFGPAQVALAGPDAEALWQRLVELESGASEQLTLVSAHHTPEALAQLRATNPGLRFVHHAACGRLQLLAESARAGAIEGLAALGFTLADATVSGAAPAVAPPVALRALRARIRAALDPGRRFALGARWEERP